MRIIRLSFAIYKKKKKLPSQKYVADLKSLIEFVIVQCHK